jgi:hypothetical protein
VPWRQVPNMDQMSLEFRAAFCVNKCWNMAVDSELTKYRSFC